MKIVIWSALGRIASYATGVGKHVARMSIGLSRNSGWGTKLLFTSDLWKKDRFRTEPSDMDSIPGIRLPFSRVAVESMWRLTRYPKLDQWAEGADWVYCPKELYVPVKRMKYAVTIHDLYRLEPKYRHKFSFFDLRWNWLLKRSVKEADLVLTVSEFTKSRIMDLLAVPAKKIRVVGNGVDEGFFTMAEQKKEKITLYPNQKYILSVGGITPKKGGSALLATAKVMEHLLLHLKLIITGPVASEFEREVSAQNNLLSLKRGFPDAEMLRLVRGAEAVVILSEYEGFGIPVLEAMAAGVPVVASKRASLPEVVGDAGILVEPTHTEDIVKALSTLLNNEEYRNRLIIKGKERAEGYRWHESVDRLCTALQEFSSNCES